MKKIIIALMLLGTICANTFAQEYDVVEAGEEFNANVNEVYVSAGSVSAINVFSTMFLAIFSFGQIDMDEIGGLPVTFTAGYNHYFKDNHLGVGGMLSYENVFGNNFLTLQGKITGQYGWEHFKIYHSASLGMALFAGSTMGVQPLIGFDFTLVGLKVDFKDFNIFAEVAAPMTGLIKLGASYKF